MLIQIVAVLTAYYLGRSGMDLNEVLAILERLIRQDNENR